MRVLNDARSSAPILTDAEGSADVLLEARMPLRLRVECDGFGPEELTFARTVPPEARVRLDRLGAISGRVMLADGRPAGPGFHVIAYRPDKPGADRELALDALDGTARHSFAVTDSGGEFVIADLGVARAWSVTAGGRGFMTREPADGVRAGAEPLRLVILPAFAVLLRFQDHQALDVERGAFASTARIRMPDEHVQSASLQRNLGSALLAGLPVDLTLPAPDPGLMIFIADREGQRVGPFRYDETLPGYEPLTAEFFADPLSLGVREEILRYRPSVRGKGRVKVRFVGCSEDLKGEEAPYGSVGSLVLTSTTLGTFSCFLRGDPATGVEAASVPYGTYRAWFRGQPPEFHFPDHESPGLLLEVGADPAEITVDARSTGSLALEFARADGSDYSGKVQVFVGSGDQQGGGFVTTGTTTFAQAPRTIPFLPEGTYVVSVQRPRGYLIDGKPRAACVIHRGRRALLRFEEAPE